MKTTIIVAIIGAISTITAAYLGRTSGEKRAREEVRYTIEVLDPAVSTGIAQADIVLMVGADSYREHTDNFGVRTFDLPPDAASELGELRVAKAGYKSWEQQVTIPSRTGRAKVFLLPNAPVLAMGGGATASTVPLEGHAEASATSRATIIDSSGAKPSGARKGFSDWYEVCSRPLPPNAKIESVEFVLSGDRSCGGWAVCQQSFRSDTKACWRFQLQGHDEWPGNGVAYSEGILRTTYTLQAGA